MPLDLRPPSVRRDGPTHADLSQPDTSGTTGGFTLPIPPGRQPPRLLVTLLLLVASVVIPLLLLEMGTLWSDFDRDRARDEDHLVQQARGVAQRVDQEFDRATGIALTLAASATLAKGDLEGFDREMRTTRDLLLGDLPDEFKDKIALFDANGMRRVYTGWKPGEFQAGSRGLPYIQDAIATGQPQNSDLINVPQAGLPCAAVAVPVFAPSSRKVVGVIAVTVSRERLLRIVQEAGLPAGPFASIQDRQGITVARSFRDAETLGKLPMPIVLRAIMSGSSGLAPPGTKTLEGVPSIIAFAHAAKSGFVVKIDIPEGSFVAPIKASLLHAITAGAVVLAAGMGMALLFARRIVHAFRQVPEVAIAATVSHAPLRRIGLREADEIAAALASALSEREQAMAEVKGLFQTSQVGIIISGLTGPVLQANDIFLTIIGRNREELEAGSIWRNEITPAEWVAADEAAMAEAMLTGRCVPYEKEYVRPDGTRVPVLISFNMTSAPNSRAAVFVVDLTELRSVEAARRQSENFVNSILDATSDCVGVLDFDGRFEFMNQPGQRQKEIDDFNAIIGRPIESLWPAESVAAVRSAIETARSGAVADYVAFAPTMKGTPKWWNVTISPLPGAEGRPMRLLAVGRDVTQARQAEAELRQQRAYFRDLVESMPQMGFITLADGYNEFQNKRWSTYTGISQDESVSDRWVEAMHPHDRERTFAAWKRALETGDTYEIEHRIRDAEGHYRWFLTRAVPLREDQTGRILRWFGTSTDISEILVARELAARSASDLEQLVQERTRELSEIQARLTQAEKMTALGQLAGGVAHDFNNVLQAVQGAASLIERRSGDAETVRRLARMAFEAAARGASITRRLLSFSHRGDLRAESIRVAPLFTGLREILTHTLGTGIGIRLEIAPELPRVMADKSQLETVMVNLATNARDAMVGNGTLTLAASQKIWHNDDVKSGRALGLKAGSFIRLSVTDTGTGMDAATLSRVMEPFFTTKPLGQGTGLGLSMARGFAEQSGGALSIESISGRGTTVTLWLPASEAEVAGPSAQPDGGIEPHGDTNRARVLVVDDDTIVREIVAEQLDAAGFNAVTAGSGRAAVALLEAGEPIDLVITDLSMPEMNGLVLIREIQRLRPRLPAVLLTGFANDAAEIALGGALSGSFSMLRKPIEGDQLVERVTVLLDGAAASLQGVRSS